MVILSLAVHPFLGTSEGQVDGWIKYLIEAQPTQLGEQVLGCAHQGIV